MRFSRLFRMGRRASVDRSCLADTLEAGKSLNRRSTRRVIVVFEPTAAGRRALDEGACAAIATNAVLEILATSNVCPWTYAFGASAEGSVSSEDEVRERLEHELLATMSSLPRALSIRWQLVPGRTRTVLRKVAVGFEDLVFFPSN